MEALTADPAADTQTQVTTTLPTTVALAEGTPSDRLTIAHFSGTHLLAGDGLLWREMENTSRLTSALHQLEQFDTRIDALVFAGDLAEFGDADAYTQLRRIVDPVADRLDAQVVWAAGEHDDRDSVRTHLLRQEPAFGNLDEAVDVDGLRIITMDSTARDSREPRMDDAQLFWLSGALAIPAARGSILVMHHPLLPGKEFEGSGALQWILAASDVRMILSGCVPAPVHAMFADIPVSAAGPVSFPHDLHGMVTGSTHRTAAPTFNIVTVHDETVMTQTVTVGSGAPLL